MAIQMYVKILLNTGVNLWGDYKLTVIIKTFVK